MDAERAYEVIKREVAAARRARLGRYEFDGDAFGNFVVRYRAPFRSWAFVNDRGQILHYPNPSWRDGELLIDDLRSADEQSLIDAVRPKLR